MKRDRYQCQWRLPDGSLCLDTATDCDHKVAGDDHRLENLQALCPMHHARKSAGEGGTAVWAKKKAAAKKFVRVEDHPGLIH
jgi:hypothetical protein